MRLIAFRVVLFATMLSVPATASAGEPVVQPVQIGAETVRYDRAVPTLDLRQQRGAVQIRPLPMDHGSLAFSVAVFNGGEAPVNIDTSNFTVTSGTQTLGVFSVDQLIAKAKNRAMWSQIGVAALGGLAAAAAASQRDTYRSTLYTPRGVYRGYYSAPSAMGQLQATAIVAGTGVGLVAIQNQLDRTREALGNDVVQMSTVNPGASYAGKIVLHKIKRAKLPQRVTITVNWNEEQYAFAFQMAKAGTPAPVFTALTAAMSDAVEEPAPVAATVQPLVSETATVTALNSAAPSAPAGPAAVQASQ